jgi:hypothetical protein
MTWFGAPDTFQHPDGNEAGVIMPVNAAADGEKQARAEAIAKVADALREKTEAEVAVLDERLSAKLDSRIFNLGSLKQYKAKVDKAVREDGARQEHGGRIRPSRRECRSARPA